MSDTTDDMEAYSGMCEDYNDIDPDIVDALEKIAYCKLSNFQNEQHMINYMKKIARIALANREY